MPLLKHHVSERGEWEIFGSVREFVSEGLIYLNKGFTTSRQVDEAERPAFLSRTHFLADLKVSAVIIDVETDIDKDQLRELVLDIKIVLTWLENTIGRFMRNEAASISHKTAHLFPNLELAVTLDQKSKRDVYQSYRSFDWSGGQDLIMRLNKKALSVFRVDSLKNEQNISSVKGQIHAASNHTTKHAYQMSIGFRKDFLDEFREMPCADRHHMMIQTADMHTLRGGRAEHRLFLSRCLSPNEWGEIILDDQNEQKRVASQQRKEGRIQRFNQLCKLMETSLDDGAKLKVCLQSTGFLDLTDKFRDRQEAALPILSLKTFLKNQKNGHRFVPRDRYMLIINIGRSFLRLQHAGMPSESLEAGALFFSCTSTPAPLIRHKRNPFVGFSLKASERHDEQSLVGPRYVLALVLMAKLMFEVWSWENLEIESGKKLQVALLAALHTAREENRLSSPQGRAIEMCLVTREPSSEESAESLTRRQLSDALDVLETHFTNNWLPKSEAEDRRTEDIDYRGPFDCETGRHQTFHIDSRTRLDSMKIRHSTSDASHLQGFQSRLRPPSDASGFFQPGASLHAFLDERTTAPPVDNTLVVAAGDFLTNICKWHRDLIGSLSVDKKARIAILDTGVNTSDPRLARAFPQSLVKKRTRSFVDGNVDDSDGHGTHVAALVARVAPSAVIYVAKIAHGTGFYPEPVVKAIEWAQECKVNVITMSWGLEHEHTRINTAIKHASTDGILFFASASNCGGLSSRSFPATMSEVIAVHASNGHGNKWDKNPSHLEGRSNFSTLGVMIPSEWKGRTEYLSGTSFATPIAAALAANILTFVRHPFDKEDLTEDEARRAFTKERMELILHTMKVTRENYDFLYPCRERWATQRNILTHIRSATMQ